MDGKIEQIKQDVVSSATPLDASDLVRDTVAARVIGRKAKTRERKFPGASWSTVFG
jgi:hypothetical protein